MENRRPSRDRLATRLARAQILPLPEHLDGAAVTAVPSGARLLGDAVSINSGVATVNLISSKLAPGQTTRQNLWAQFVATLTQDPAVTRVSLSVDDVPVNLLTLDGSAGTLAEIGFIPPPPVTLAAPVVRRGEEVAVFDPSSLGDQEPREPADQRAYPAVPAGFSRLALSADGSEVAAINPGGDGISRWRDANRYVVPLPGGAVGSPSYDRRGWLWVGAVGAGGAGAPRLFVVNTASDPAGGDAAAVAIEAAWLAGRRVLEARVSPDGDRIAVLSTAADGRDARIDLTGIVRSRAGQPQRTRPVGHHVHRPPARPGRVPVGRQRPGDRPRRRVRLTRPSTGGDLDRRQHVVWGHAGAQGVPWGTGSGSGWWAQRPQPVSSCCRPGAQPVTDPAHRSAEPARKPCARHPRGGPRSSPSIRHRPGCRPAVRRHRSTGRCGWP